MSFNPMPAPTPTKLAKQRYRDFSVYRILVDAPVLTLLVKVLRDKLLDFNVFHHGWRQSIGKNRRLWVEEKQQCQV